MRDGRRPLKISQEVGDARYDADVGIGTDVAQHLGEGLLRAAEENLARLHEWTGPARILVDVPANIRVTNDGEEKRHLASLRFDLRSFSKNSVSANLSCHL